MADVAADGYERYYAEKLWQLIPSVHRHEDGIAAQPGVLRALVEILAGQAALLRRSQDRLWEDGFIELCDDWSVPYIGELVGTRLVSALDPRARRTDVANTIHYRRRKGTVRVLEQLVADITGWEGKVTESFRSLARGRHGLDPAPSLALGLVGRFSGTPRGGVADLRDVRVAALAGGPFEEYAHTPDVRRARGLSGLFNIPRILFHLFRLVAEPVEGATPFARADGLTFTFDPSGREVPLFAPRRRLTDFDEWRSALPWEVPAPLSCRLLGHAEYQIEEALVQALEAGGIAQAPELRRIAGVRFRDEARLRDGLSLLPSAVVFLGAGVFDQILEGALVADCGKNALVPTSAALPGALWIAPTGAAILPRARVVAGDLGDFTLTVPDKDAIVDPERGRFKLLQAIAPPSAGARVAYHYGRPGPIGAGTYDRSDFVAPPPKTLFPAATVGSQQIAFPAGALSGVFEVVDSATYSPIDDVDVTALVLQAADQERPYVRLQADWIVTAPGPAEATLDVDGLWFGAEGAFAIVLRGPWTRVAFRHATLDPGGTDVDGDAIRPVRLVVEGEVDELIIDHSIIATIEVRGRGLIDRVAINDSILDAAAAGGPALALSPGRVELRRVTVFGALDVEGLDASEALITGNVDVTDTQNGCFRFSAAPAGSRLPRPYRSHVLPPAPHVFTSVVFGHPGYAQLSASAPEALVRGAENGSEIGAWSSLINPIKLDSLSHKVEEFLPFGLIPVFIQRT
jgi:hypothetical protein